MLDLNKNLFVQNKYDKDYIQKKTIKLRKFKLLKNKKYFESLE